MSTLANRNTDSYWTSTVDVGPFGNLSDLLTHTASRFPDRTAISWNDEEIPWAELLEAVSGRAARLVQMGVTPGTCVALALPNCPAFIVSFFALASIGAISVPINPAYKAPEVQEYLKSADASILVTTGQLGNDLRTAGLPGEIELLTVEAQGTEDSGPGPVEIISTTLDDVVLHAFSSGSTGKPKRLSRTNFNLLSEAAGFHKTVGLSDQDVVIGIAPMFHAHGLGNALLASVASGAELVLVEEFDRRKIVDLLVRKSITFFPGVPLIFSALAALRRLPPSSSFALKTCFTAGSPLLKQVSIDFQEKFGAPVRQLYGCSEAGSVTINLDDAPDFVAESVGTPIGWGEVKILGENQDDLPQGSSGEIAISTPTLTAAYDGLPDATVSAFKGRWFSTGDIGYLDSENRLYVTGRKKLYISTGGFKVDPVEVERVLASHPLVTEAVVLGIPQNTGEEMVKAVVVGTPELSREELVSHCKSRLATFKIPRIFEFRNEIPRNAVGKILLKDLM